MTWTPRNIWIASGAVAAVVFVLILIAAFSSGAFEPKMSIESAAFTSSGELPAKYTCDGEGTSPPITIRNIPEDAKSIVLYVLDMDAPKSGFVHWVVYNMDPRLTDLPEGQVPNGSVEGLNGTGKTSYHPPCPPSGKHRYLFTAYAVSSTYHFVRTPDIDHLKKVMIGQVLARATVTATYTHR